MSFIGTIVISTFSAIRKCIRIVVTIFQYVTKKLQNVWQCQIIFTPIITRASRYSLFISIFTSERTEYNRLRTFPVL